ncbi:aldehyde dehydrogenase family protein [Ketobacter alkanivorans]|uniref:aldehyde dehydrogenase (NAD(+)) n=1 Tax=Ketobacter alkanivorans TaxID=1917421 RepID=A0A2K9LR89_9GAMM|nr:aldehyde dehydrogenase family protein [Ketobacter alkanivorans]AUM13975.1 aldehyde dehydrogenase family protein [Ketobacter alkanivorans]MCP5017879.1 aldehyde dehydrogenase family protein [Ketobacter sp.]
MYEYTNFYINGQWVLPEQEQTLEVLNPATEQPMGVVSMGTKADVDKAVAAAKAAFPAWSQTSRAQRISYLEAIIQAYQLRLDDIAAAISQEMGAPMWLATAAHAPTGLGHFVQALEVLQQYEFEAVRGQHRLRKEPIGVCGLITPWNWPINQIACKVAPAIAAGCTMVLKPSEVAPIDAMIFAEIIHQAGLPAGVFNLVNGDGTGVGAALTGHPDVDMVSFTGSTRAGVAIAKNAADTVKRVAQELGGKSANIILDDANLESAIVGGVNSCFMNSGQSCNAPTRMLVPASKLAEATAIAKAAGEAVVAGMPEAEGTNIGPVVSEVQFNKIQALIQQGIDEGAELVVGGTGKPAGLETGYFVKPTIFSHVNNQMTIAREEIFGPVLCILPYADEDDAIAIANDTPYGLSAYVSGSQDRAVRVANLLRAGNVHINGAGVDFSCPFGGYKQSGNGREWGKEGFDEYLEVKAILGCQSA